MQVATATITEATDSAASISDNTRAFLEILHQPGDVFEIRAMNCPERIGGTFRATWSGYFNDIALAAMCASNLDGLGPPGVYATLNPAIPDLVARSVNHATFRAKHTTSDAEILRRRCLMLDFDPVRPPGISSTNAERDAALDLARQVRDSLREENWPAPLLAMSGNGAYLLYRIDLPNDDDARQLIKDTLAVLSGRFNTATVTIDTAVYNAARLVKVVGTTARKGDRTEDRPHRRSWFEPPREPLQVVPTDLLRQVAAEANTARHNSTRGTTLPADERPRVAAARERIMQCPDAISGRGGHDATFHAACECVRFDLTEAESMRVMREFNETKTGGEPWTDAELRHKIRDARRRVEGDGEVGVRLPESRPAARATPLRPSDDTDGAIPSIQAADGRTEMANAKRFVARFGDRVRWCEPWKKWLVWDGKRWKVDDTCHVESLAKQVAEDLWQRIREISTEVQT